MAKGKRGAPMATETLQAVVAQEVGFWGSP